MSSKKPKKPKQLSKAQQWLVAELRSKRSMLWWYGDNGPELTGTTCRVQRRTVEVLLAQGVLRWCDYCNEPQLEAGIRQLVLTNA